MIPTLRRLRQEAATCKTSMDYTVKQADHEVKQESGAVGCHQTQRNSATKVWQLCPTLDNGVRTIGTKVGWEGGLMVRLMWEWGMPAPSLPSVGTPVRA